MTTKLKNILLWTGAIGALITAIAYIIIMVVMIIGFEQSMQMEQLITVAVLGAVTGFLITLMLRGQGVSLASNEPNSKEVMAEYYKIRNKKKKEKKLHTIAWHVNINAIKDIFTKVITVGATTSLSLYIFLEGSGDFALIGLALVNILMFVAFGIMAMVKAYNFYIEEHIPAIIEITIRIKNTKDQVGSVPLEREEHAKPEIPDTTATSAEEQRGHQEH